MKKIIIMLSLAALMPLSNWAQKFIEKQEYILRISDEWSESNEKFNNILLLHGPSKMDYKNNITVLTQSNLDNKSLELFVKSSEKQILAMYENAVVLENKRISDRVHQLTFKGTLMGQDFTCVHRIVFAGQQFYLISFTSTPSEFDELKKNAIPIVESFQLK